MPAFDDHQTTLLNPAELFDSRPTFSHLAVTAPSVRLVYCAGQVGADVNRNPADGLEAQARLAFTNVKHCLAAAGASVRDVVKLTYYVVGWTPEMGPTFRKALLEFLTDDAGVHRSPSTLISVQGLADPRWLVEIDAVAAIKA